MGSWSVRLAMLASVACSGPKPDVLRVAVSDSASPGYVRVEMDVENRSSGHGQAILEVTLVNRESGAKHVAERALSLVAHQQVHVTADIPAPRGVYEAHVKAAYPD